MKTKLSIITLLLLFSLSSFAQKKSNSVVVLYFKAELACCKARACNQLEADVNKVIKQNFENKKVTFKEIKLNDAANQAVIDLYNAKSQTVILVATNKKNKTTSVDVSAIIAEYATNNNFESFSEKLTEEINKLL